MQRYEISFWNGFIDIIITSWKHNLRTLCWVSYIRRGVTLDKRDSFEYVFINIALD